MLKLYIFLKISILGFPKCFGNSGGLDDPQCQDFIRLIGIIFFILVVIGIIITLYEKYEEKNNNNNKIK